MKKIVLILITLISTFSFSQTTLGNPNHDNIYGIYKSSDGTQILEMIKNKDGKSIFIRTSPKGIVTGEFKEENNELYVKKPTENYSLKYYLETTHLIVIRPEQRPWLFTKIGQHN